MPRMATVLTDLLAAGDASRIPADILRKLENLWRLSQDEMARTVQTAVSSYQSAVAGLQTALAEASAKCPDSWDAEPRQPAATPGVAVRPAKGLRRENLLLAEKLREALLRNRKLREKERALDAQVSVLLLAADKDKRELTKVIAEYAAEIAAYRAADKSAARPTGSTREILSMVSEVGRLRASNEALRRELSRGAADILRLRNESAAERAALEVARQFQNNYEGLYDRFMRLEMELTGSENRNAELKRTSEQLERIYQQGITQSGLQNRVCDYVSALGERMECLESACARQAEYAERSSRANIKRLNSASIEHLQDGEAIPSRDVRRIIDEYGRIDLSSVRQSIRRMAAVQDGLRRLFDGAAERLPAGGTDVAAEAEQLRRDNEVLREANLLLKKELDECQVLIGELLGKASHGEAEGASSTADYEAAGDGPGPFDEAYYKQWIGGLEAQVEEYKRDVQAIEEKYQQYRQLWNELDVDALRTENGQLREAVAQKDSYIEKQGALLEKYRKFKEAVEKRQE